MHPTLAIIITLATMGLLILSASFGVRKDLLGAEAARKFVHVGMGLTCAIFPWIFNTAFPVQVLAALAVASILLIRCTSMRQQLGACLFSVSRISIGELLFPIAVAWLFTLYKVNQDSAVYYVIPLLLLTLADTAGAIFGTRLGRSIYKTASGTKSVEGSIAFFLTAFICTIIPLYFFTPHDLSHLIFASFAVALFFTLVEGASGAGVDNILIPIGAYFLLIYYLELSSESLWLRSLILFLILLLFILTRTKHSLNGGATLSAILLCFISFMMGGFYCLVASLLMLTRHMIAMQKTPENLRHRHSIEAVLAVAAPAVTWLTLGRGNVIDFAHSQLFFIVSLALTISMLHIGTRKYLTRSGLALKRILIANLMGATILTLSLPMTNGLSFYGYAIPFIIIASIVFHYVRSNTPSLLGDWIKLFSITSFSSLTLYYFYATTH